MIAMVNVMRQVRLRPADVQQLTLEHIINATAYSNRSRVQKANQPHTSTLPVLTTQIHSAIKLPQSAIR
jgi:hypothetical protein